MRNWHSLYEILTFPIGILFFAFALLGIGNLLTNSAYSVFFTIHNDLILVLAEAMCIALAACAGAFAVPARAEGATVRIGYYYDSDYFYRDDQGRYCGYDAEYFYEISKYASWKYEYIDYDSFEDAYEALVAGEIDILPSLFYSRERAQKLLFSEQDMGQR